MMEEYRKEISKNWASMTGYRQKCDFRIVQEKMQ